MRKFLPKFKTNPLGFTLVELLVVISIIAILAVIGLAIFSGVQKNARDAKRKGDIDAIAKALEVNRTNTGYVALANDDFAGGNMPTTDPQSNYYCGNTTVNVQPANPTASWTTTCPGSYSQIGTTIPVPVAGATSWKICTWLESGSAYCRVNQQ